MAIDAIIGIQLAPNLSTRFAEARHNVRWAGMRSRFNPSDTTSRDGE
jgi:hypothetical protein